MKTLAKVVGTIVVCLVLVLVVMRITGFNPIGDKPGAGNYPGLWLSGEVVTNPVTDWSFVKQYKTDKVQTRTRYMIPHSVTTGFIVHDGQLYITSMFAAGVPFPQGKAWVANVMRDPHVRLKFGNNLYDCVLSPVTDSAEDRPYSGRERSRTLTLRPQSPPAVRCCTYFTCCPGEHVFEKSARLARNTVGAHLVPAVSRPE